MGMKYTNVAVLLCALAGLKLAAPGAVAPRAADAQTRNCPDARDQFVGVSGGAVAFRLDVDNPAGSRISIFQYPMGGILEQAGPTELDYVFVPSADFRGTTTFTYRLIPPLGCTRSTLLGRVTIAAGPLPGGSIATAPSGPVPLPEEPETCGLDWLGLLAGLGLGFFNTVGTVRRRRSRRPANARAPLDPPSPSATL